MQLTDKTILPHRAKLPKPGLALVLLFSIFAFFLILTPILTGFIGKLCQKPAAALRIAMVIQDMLVFVLPPLVTALACTKLPARLLAVDTRPNLMSILLASLTLVCSIPAMNLVIEWNEHLHLPESLSSVEVTLRELETNAQAVTDMLMAGASIPSLIVSVLIVGVLAGFSEELFFRGGMLRIISASKTNMHVAVWTVAFVFSLFHFQFFGFVPRMLLGAYFGYLLWWSGSLWVPVIAHTLNNSIVVIAAWHSVNSPDATLNVDKIGTDTSSAAGVILACVSVVVTIVMLWITRRQAVGKNNKSASNY